MRPGGCRPFRLAAWDGARALATVTSRCGCKLLWEALQEPDPEARAPLEEVARDLQARWRCPAAGHPPGPIRDDLSTGLSGALEEAERVVGLKTHTCPRACLERAPAQLLEITRALAVSEEAHGVPLAEALGRELTEADHQALAALVLARRERRAWEIEHPPKREDVKDPTP